MALKFFTGFDHYTNTDLTTGPTPRFTTATVTTGITTSNPRTGSRCLRLSTGDSVTRTGMANDAAVSLGAALRFDAFTDAGRVFMAVSDGAPTTAGNVQVGLAYDATGHFTLWRGRAVGSASGGTQIGSASATAVTASAYYYVELAVTVNNATGTVDVWVTPTAGTGSVYLGVTGQDTQATGNAYANAFGLAGTSDSLNFDDVYFDTVRNGDSRAIAVNASTGNGTHADSTPSSGSDRGAMVDEGQPNSDTDYNTLSSVADVDTYNFPALTTTGNLLGLNLHNYVRKVDPGTRTSTGKVLISGTLYDGTAQTLSTSYGYATDLFQNSPATAGAWFSTEVDGAEFGVERTA